MYMPSHFGSVWLVWGLQLTVYPRHCQFLTTCDRDCNAMVFTPLQQGKNKNDPPNDPER